MTIITQLILDKKLKKQKDPLVAQDTSSINKQDIEADNHNAPLIVTLKRSRARISSLTTICVFLTALLVFTTGLIGGFYLYRQFTQYTLRHFRGWCSIPYSESRAFKQFKFPEQTIGETRGIESAASIYRESQKYSSEIFAKPAFDKFFDEEVDLDIENDEYERIEVPDFSYRRRGRFIHDFSVNKTGIIDLTESRCFVMPLNRSEVLPPHSLYDIVIKMKSGYYNVDTKFVRESYHVVTPAITDKKSIGYYIARECANLPTYRLEKVISSVFKRSVNDETETVFAEFAGVYINEIQILNLNRVPGKK